MKNKKLLLVIAGCFGLVLLCCVTLLIGYFVVLQNDIEKLKDDIGYEDNNEGGQDTEPEQVDDTEEIEETPEIDMTPFEMSFGDELIAMSTLNFSGYMPTDAEVYYNEYGVDFDKASIVGDDFELIFNLVYEAYPFTYDILIDEEVSNEQFGDIYLTQAEDVLDVAYYTTDYSEVACDFAGELISAPCGSGAVSYEDNIGDSFFFMRCEFDSKDGLDKCNAIVETLELDGTRDW